MPTKTCSGPCRRNLELSEQNFRKDRTSATGYKYRCKSCQSGKWSKLEEFDKSLGGVPEGFSERGRSTLYDRNGQVVAEWVKTAKDVQDEANALLKALEGLGDKWEKPAAIKKPKGPLADDLLTVVPIGDAHIGMFSWAEETGQDFDLKIAEANLVAAVDHLVSLAPRAKKALLINLGDFMHSDNARAETTLGTRVDVDSRWSKILRVAIRAMRRCIERLLETHEQVHVICEIGNHDSNSAVMLALALEQFYENEPRVFIDTSPAKFHWYTFGQNLIGVTHGDTAKIKELPTIMACDRAQDWGNTTQRYWYTGHVHHQTAYEFGGCTVETFRTLAPSDAWHKAKGYRSGQDLKLDVIHKKYGRINRHVVGINQIWDLK
jgi:hypothetical protein